MEIPRDASLRGLIERQKRIIALLCSGTANGTKSAKRRLKAMRNRWQRFRLDCSRVIAARATENLAPGTTIVLEDLAHIRDRAKQRGPE